MNSFCNTVFVIVMQIKLVVVVVNLAHAQKTSEGDLRLENKLVPILNLGLSKESRVKSRSDIHVCSQIDMIIAYFRFYISREPPF